MTPTHARLSARSNCSNISRSGSSAPTWAQGTGVDRQRATMLRAIAGIPSKSRVVSVLYVSRLRHRSPVG